MNKLGVDFTIVSFLPNWDDADYIKNFIGSKYTVDSRIVNKGNYILHEKDKGKILNRIRNFSNYLQSNYDKYVNNQTEPTKQLVAEPETKLV
jgi:hypothetical protein